MNDLRQCLVLLLWVVAIPTLARAQDSQFSLQGPGTPGRSESVRARATGGAFAPFDALSWMTDAALADLRRFTASAHGIASFRRVEVAAGDADLRATRFPSFLVGGPPVGNGRLVVAAGFGTYLDRTYRTSVRDSAVIRGEMERFTDAIASDGGVTDIRFAGAWRFSPRAAIGGAFHLLSGATRSSAARAFDDSANYHSAFEVTDVQHTGMGASAGAMLDLVSAVRLAVWLRTDTDLRVSVRDVETTRYGLPTTVGGALRWTPTPDLRLAALVSRQSWADAGGRNTVAWAIGAEGGSPALPVRIGVRGATMPFGPVGVEPREFAVAAGLARSFSDGRARVDLTVERLTRSGGSVRETAWSVLLGLTVQP